MTLIIFIRKDYRTSLWKKKGDMCWNNDVLELSKLINENKNDFYIKIGFEEGDKK
jgi:hypothetical protein